MASYDIAKPGSFPQVQSFDKIGTGTATPTLTVFFVQRAWNTAWSAYETWISEGSADPNPPSGESITGLTTAAVWQEVV